MRSLSEGSDSGALTLADLENFIAACRSLGMDPAQTTIAGTVSGFKAHVSGAGQLATITASHAAIKATASPTPMPAPVVTTMPIPVTPPVSAAPSAPVA